MTGRTISTYSDVNNRLENLRSKYVLAEISIRSKSRVSKIEQLRALMRAHYELRMD